MKVDRSRFLLITGAISAATAAGMAVVAGCTVNSTTVNSDSGVIEPVDSGSGSDDGGTTTTSDGSAGDGSSTADSGTDAGACLGGGSVTEGGDGGADCDPNGCAIACDNSVTYFKAEVAAAIDECLVKLPSCESPDNDQGVADCANDAIVKACADTNAPTICQPIVAGCADAGATFTEATCESFVSALNETGQAAFTSCFAEGCAADTPDTCIASVAP